MTKLFKRAVVVKEGKQWIPGIEQVIPRKAATYDFNLCVWHEASEPDKETGMVDLTIRIMGPELGKVEGMVEVFENELGATLLADEK
ncbi:hypothetical protein P7D58_02505 [Enterococcus avium]|uniref:hypothetical protein n=1 Tax=Enterococcus avium TaxID=33945 RepID=UPI00288CCAA7|nr:hypothetical protein [Enterococcus avium]MDT2392775.1 hypothetical protein [Enterococcus avium]MDT2416589.1 hypothetical protein [Enterococcus avium]MDT2429877.1 hypothetical protein [Enterococcus avium]MDT2438907.1 hypothetical protein [Enterococcus avium]MDT2451983.1 hypothetical protein [Enterococcus avium]